MILTFKGGVLTCRASSTIVRAMTLLVNPNRSSLVVAGIPPEGPFLRRIRESGTYLQNGVVAPGCSDEQPGGHGHSMMGSHCQVYREVSVWGANQAQKSLADETLRRNLHCVKETLFIRRGGSAGAIPDALRL